MASWPRTKAQAKATGTAYGDVVHKRRLDRLIVAISLVLVRPEIPSCSECQKFVFDPDNGWKRLQHRGRDLERPAGVPTPCVKCPRSEPRDARPRPDREMNSETWQALDYFFLCREDRTALLPRDELTVRQNALIARIESQVNRNRGDVGPILAAMMATIGGGVAAGRMRR